MWSPTHVQVTVCRARNLKAKGKSGTNDAYVLIKLGKERYQTSVCERTKDPEWMEQCDFPLNEKNMVIKLKVYHRNLIGLDEFLGQVSLHVEEFEVHERPRPRWYALLSKPGTKSSSEQNHGELQIVISFQVQSLSGSQLTLSRTSNKAGFSKGLSSVRGIAHQMSDKFASQLSGKAGGGRFSLRSKYSGKHDSDKSRPLSGIFLPTSNNNNYKEPNVISKQVDEAGRVLNSDDDDEDSRVPDYQPEMLSAVSHNSIGPSFHEELTSVPESPNSPSPPPVSPDGKCGDGSDNTCLPPSFLMDESKHSSELTWNTTRSQKASSSSSSSHLFQDSHSGQWSHVTGALSQVTVDQYETTVLSDDVDSKLVSDHWDEDTVDGGDIDNSSAKVFTSDSTLDLQPVIDTAYTSPPMLVMADTETFNADVNNPATKCIIPLASSLTPKLLLTPAINRDITPPHESSFGSPPASAAQLIEEWSFDTEELPAENIEESPPRQWFKNLQSAMSQEGVQMCLDGENSLAASTGRTETTDSSVNTTTITMPSRPMLRSQPTHTPPTPRTLVHGDSQPQQQWPLSPALVSEYFDYSREDLMRLVGQQRQQLRERDAHIADLERYIDNLLVKVIDLQPLLLCSACDTAAPGSQHKQLLQQQQTSIGQATRSAGFSNNNNNNGRQSSPFIRQMAPPKPSRTMTSNSSDGSHRLFVLKSLQALLK